MHAGVGRVVVLDGASSSGKSTLAEGFASARAARGECWITVGLDDFLAKLRQPWFETPSVQGDLGADGIRFTPSADGLVISLGDVGRRLFGAYRRSVALWARQGFDVVVDDITFDRAAADDWDRALDGLAVTWVAVRCDTEVLAAREARRGDREAGLARWQSLIVHTFRSYDLELDTGTAGPVELVAALDAFVGSSAAK